MKETLNFIRKSLSSMSNSLLKTLGNKVAEILSEVDENFRFSQWYSVILDIVDSKLVKEPASKPKRTRPENICKIRFDNKGIELINVGRILRSEAVLEALPSDANAFESPTVFYNLLPPISLKIFNFNKFVSDENILLCNCENSPFKDAHHGHIVIGNIDMVSDSHLKKLFLKGPKYREPKSLDWEKARDAL